MFVSAFAIAAPIKIANHIGVYSYTQITIICGIKITLKNPLKNFIVLTSMMMPPKSNIA
jgi:hypothetical protein